MVETGHVCLPEIDRGSVTGGGVFLRRLGVPEGAVREILLTGRRIPASEALSLGLVDRVVGSERLMEAAQELAQAMASKDRQALRLTKQAMYEAETVSGWVAGYLATFAQGSKIGDLPATEKSNGKAGTR